MKFNWRNLKSAHKKIVQELCNFDGKGYQWWEFRYTTKQLSGGEYKTAGLLLNIQDIKDREEELEAARLLAEKAELKQSFLANMSHEKSEKQKRAKWPVVLAEMMVLDLVCSNFMHRLRTHSRKDELSYVVQLTQEQSRIKRYLSYPDWVALWTSINLDIRRPVDALFLIRSSLSSPHA